MGRLRTTEQLNELFNSTKMKKDRLHLMEENRRLKKQLDDFQAFLNEEHKKNLQRKLAEEKHQIKLHNIKVNDEIAFYRSWLNDLKKSLDVCDDEDFILYKKVMIKSLLRRIINLKKTLI